MWVRVRCGRSAKKHTHVFLSLRGGGGGKGQNNKATVQTSSVPSQWATIWHSLPAVDAERLEEVLDSRLATSTVKRINVGAKKWVEFCATRGIHPVVVTGDPARGSYLISFVLSLLDNTSLVYASIDKYVWGVRTWNKLHREADPIRGVEGWEDFMKAVKVLSWVPAEPRIAMPKAAVQDILKLIDASCKAKTAVFWEVQFAFLMVILLFTFSRSECPLPKNFSGTGSFDPMQHWLVADIQMKKVRVGQVLGVRFKVVKSDARIERPEARGTTADPATSVGGDWATVGDIPGSIFSVFLWYRRLVGFWDGQRPLSQPFFRDRNQKRTYTYSCAMADLRTFLELIDFPKPWPGLHGFRVEGNNLSRHTNGVDLTDAQGGWHGGARTRYDRFDQYDVASIPANMIGESTPYVDVQQPPREFLVGPRTVRGVGETEVGLVSALEGSSESDSEVQPTVNLLPPGFTCAKRFSKASAISGTTRGRAYKTYFDSDGKQYNSIRACWDTFKTNVSGSSSSDSDSQQASTPSSVGRRGFRAVSPASRERRRVAPGEQGQRQRGKSREVRALQESQ